LDIIGGVGAIVTLLLIVLVSLAWGVPWVDVLSAVGDAVASLSLLLLFACGGELSVAANVLSSLPGKHRRGAAVANNVDRASAADLDLGEKIVAFV